MTEIHEFIPHRHRERSSDETAARPAANLDSLIQRVAGASTDEIDEVISELKRMRDALHREGERLSGDIARYASLNQSLMAAMKIVSENLKEWKDAPVTRDRELADFKARWLGGNHS